MSVDGGMLTLDTGALHSKWIRDIFDEQNRNPPGPNQGCGPSQAPVECWDGADEHGWCLGGGDVEAVGQPPSCGAPHWAVAAMVIPHAMWRHHGDLRIISDHYDGMQRFMEWMTFTADNTTGLVSHARWADWCAPKTNKEAPIAEPHQVAAFSQLMGWSILAEVSDALDKSKEAAVARTTLARLKREYNHVYYRDENATYHDDVQTANAMPLWLGIPQNLSQTARVLASLKADVEARDHHVSTGIIGTRVLFDALSNNNATETAYALAIQDTYPSHGFFVRQNATRCALVPSTLCKERD